MLPNGPNISLQLTSWVVSLCLCLASSRLRDLATRASFVLFLSAFICPSGPCWPSVRGTPAKESLRVLFSRLPAKRTTAMSRASSSRFSSTSSNQRLYCSYSSSSSATHHTPMILMCCFENRILWYNLESLASIMPRQQVI